MGAWVHIEQSEKYCAGMSDSGDDSREKSQHQGASEGRLRSVLANPGVFCRTEMRRGAAQGISHVSQDMLIRC